ncbi:MAG TPA: metallophosphoesterase, partial [Mobilitalea sp.]|nr:metallophosphoesterase [Mobilitalea sp.]
MSTAKRLSRVLATSREIPFDESSRIVIMSDCHRGDGDWADDFSNNQNLYFAALTYYYESGYTYIELGDGDELWENRDLNMIINIHSDVFWLLSLFYKDERLHMLYGNHDIVKRDPKYMMTKCNSYYCESLNSRIALFPGINITEGLILRYKNSNNRILLAHGHQGDLL